MHLYLSGDTPLDSSTSGSEPVILSLSPGPVSFRNAISSAETAKQIMEVTVLVDVCGNENPSEYRTFELHYFLMMVTTPSAVSLMMLLG